TEVAITDILPDSIVGAAATPAQGTCAPSAATCALGTVAVGASVAVTVTGTVDPAAPAGPITNTAAVSSVVSDPSRPNTRGAATTAVSRSAAVSIPKAVSPTTLVPGTSATFTLTVTNAGPSSATSVTVTDVLPAGLAVTGTTPSAPCGLTGQTVSC